MTDLREQVERVARQYLADDCRYSLGRLRRKRNPTKRKIMCRGGIDAVTETLVKEWGRNIPSFLAE